MKTEDKKLRVNMFRKSTRYLLNDIYTKIVNMLLKIFRNSKLKYLVDMQECSKTLQDTSI